MYLKSWAQSLSKDVGPKLTSASVFYQKVGTWTQAQLFAQRHTALTSQCGHQPDLPRGVCSKVTPAFPLTNDKDPDPDKSGDK